MAKEPEQPKSLEMRVAELEDKLSKLHISEEEMKTYQKVASALGVGAAATQPAVATGAGAAAIPQLCIVRQCYRLCNYHHCYVCYYTACYQQCINECGGGGCLAGGGTPAAGGFGSLGG